MLTDASRHNLSNYPDYLRALIEDVSKTINLDIDAPLAADVAANRIVIMPASMTLADAHYNAGFLRRACQNHGIHMQWDGESKPEEIDVVCSFTFITMEAHQKALDAKIAAPQTVAKSEPAKQEPAPAIKQAEQKPSSAPGKNS